MASLLAHPAPTLLERRTQYADLFAQACRLGEQYALTYDHPCCTLAKRVLRHQDELFQFVLVPGLPADNNLAERSIRPLVIMRKISGGSRRAVWPPSHQTPDFRRGICHPLSRF